MRFRSPSIALGIASVLALLEVSFAAAAEGPTTSIPRPELPGGVIIPQIPSALELDVSGNPVYTLPTKAALRDQILDDFSDFDHVGLVPGSASPDASQGANAPLHLYSVRLEDPYDLHFVTQFCSPSGACELPLDYNVSTPQVRLVWTFRDQKVEGKFLDYINETNDRGLDVKLNGVALRRNAVSGPLIPIIGKDDYSASYKLGRPCPPSRQRVVSRW